MDTLEVQALSRFDEAKLSKYHARMVITAGMGFFTDAYDLFVIGVVTALLLPIWHLSITQLAILNGASLAAAAFGAIFFGSLADKIGRKKIYGYEVLILFVGAILSACALSFTWLLLARILVGFGIGGDYPTSAVVASENANRRNRGFLVLLVFAMQALGLIIGPSFASLLLALHISPDIAWRVLLGFGAIPAASVFYLRKTIHESKHFKKAKSMPFEVSRMVSELAGHDDHVKIQSLTKRSLLKGKWLKYIIGTAGAWFILDVAFYGNGISSVLIMKTISPHADILTHTLLSALIFLCFAVPGYFLAAMFVDKIGRKVLQILGFAMMAICYALISLVPHLTEHMGYFLFVFGISFFFVNFGPNTTTFLIPSEIYPTQIRASAHGISAAIGKVGAFIGAFFLPILLKSLGLHITLVMMATICILGILVTFLVPEMKQVSLMKVDDEENLKFSH
ncbi:MAG: MFS transporter [Pseudomonadota bacterium]